MSMEWRQSIRLNVMIVVLIMAIAPCVIIWNQQLLQREFTNMRTCAEMEEYLLESRRHEKNYFMRGGVEYVELQRDYSEKLNDAALSLRQNRLIEDRVNLLLEKRRLYAERFEVLVSEIKAGLRDGEVEDEGMTSMVMAARECEALIREIRGLTGDRFESVVSRTHFVNFLSVILGIFVSTLVSGVIADRIIARNAQRSLA